MSKLLAILMAATFAAVNVTPAFAQADSKKQQTDKKTATKKKGDTKK